MENGITKTTTHYSYSAHQDKNSELCPHPTGCDPDSEAIDGNFDVRHSRKYPSTLVYDMSEGISIS